jgi:polyisoprenoid-binding protein YceI
MTDTSGKWMSKDHLKAYTDKVVSMCIVAAVNTPTTHAKTTYDLDVAQATIENSIKNIKLTFGRDV